jgi:hypothetical protein
MFSNLKILLIFLAGFTTFVLLKHLERKHKNNCHSKSNRYVTDVTEVIPNINYKIVSNQKAHHLFWTGGFDSTYRLCEILLLLDRPIQTIYLMCGEVDSEPTVFDIMNTKRQNTELEIQKMKEIRHIIIKQNPHLAVNFLPTHYVKNIKVNKEVTKKFQNLHQKHGFFSRNINQYERMSRFSSDYPFPIEVGLESCGTGLDEATKKYRVGEGTSCQLKDKLPKDKLELEVFRNLRFPISHITKEEMKLKAIKNNFYHILKMTVSCWFPSTQGEACGKCDMCVHRII